MANDLTELDALFAPGADTIRGDAGGVVIGHDAISDFRRGRGGSPQRRILAVDVRAIDADAAFVVAVTAPRSGGRGQQSQLWHRFADGWRVRAAHVSLPSPAIAASIWRVVGTPLVPAGADGELRGHSIAVKDLFAVAGQAVGAGVPRYLAESPAADEHAAAVAALVEAGASITGIAHTDEFAYSVAGRNPHYGTPPNPSVVGGIPGGSTSGPASAVALGQASLGLGTDTGGSIRVPASYQGLWGLRTTHGAVDARGLLPLAPSFDTIGWLARDALTVSAAARVSLIGREHRAAGTSFVVAPALARRCEPAVQRAFDAALDTVAPRLRAPIVEVDLGDIDDMFEIFRTVQAAEAWRSHGAWIDAHPGALGAEIAARFAWAATITPQQESDARLRLATARHDLDAVLGDRILVLPSTSSIAPSALADAAEIERTRSSTLRLTCVAGITGRPALSVPAMTVPQPSALTPAPIGLCLVGPRWSDLSLVDAGDQWARLLS